MPKILIKMVNLSIYVFICITELVPKNNMSMRRDIMESMARCHLHLDQLDEALTISESLVSISIFNVKIFA